MALDDSERLKLQNELDVRLLLEQNSEIRHVETLCASLLGFTIAALTIAAAMSGLTQPAVMPKWTVLANGVYVAGAALFLLGAYFQHRLQDIAEKIGNLRTRVFTRNAPSLRDLPATHAAELRFIGFGRWRRPTVSSPLPTVIWALGLLLLCSSV